MSGNEIAGGLPAIGKRVGLSWELLLANPERTEDEPPVKRLINNAKAVPCFLLGCLLY